MRFDYDNCSIILDDGKGNVYRNGKLMFKGDGYVAIKFLLQFTNNAEQVRNKFHAQLSQEEEDNYFQNGNNSFPIQNIISKINIIVRIILHYP